MGTSPAAQALALLPALLLGLGLGLLYDLLRPLRRRCPPLPAAGLDLLYALAAAAAVFVRAMAAGGRFGLWELTAALLGFLLYLYALSPLVLPLLDLPFRVMRSTMGLFKKMGKARAKTEKNSLQTQKNGLL